MADHRAMTDIESGEAAQRSPGDAVAAMRISAPSERNRKLAGLLAAANESTQLKARWYAQQVTAERLGMSDHSWVHLRIVLNIALADIYDEPDRTVIASEVLHAIIGHRKGGRPLTLEAGVVRVADALDMEHGRSRVAFETQLANIHSLSAAAIDDVRILRGKQRTIRVEIDMNNSAGVFQVDELLASKLRGSGLEEHIEVIAQIDAEHEKRLLSVYRI
jgi:uncharacterized protein